MHLYAHTHAETTHTYAHMCTVSIQEHKEWAYWAHRDTHIPVFLYSLIINARVGLGSFGVLSLSVCQFPELTAAYAVIALDMWCCLLANSCLSIWHWQLQNSWSCLFVGTCVYRCVSLMLSHNMLAIFHVLASCVRCVHAVCSNPCFCACFISVEASAREWTSHSKWPQCLWLFVSTLSLTNIAQNLIMTMLTKCIHVLMVICSAVTDALAKQCHSHSAYNMRSQKYVLLFTWRGSFSYLSCFSCAALVIVCLVLCHNSCCAQCIILTLPTRFFFLFFLVLSTPHITSNRIFKPTVLDEPTSGKRVSVLVVLVADDDTINHD